MERESPIEAIRGPALTPPCGVLGGARQAGSGEGDSEKKLPCWGSLTLRPRGLHFNSLLPHETVACRGQVKRTACSVHEPATLPHRFVSPGRDYRGVGGDGGGGSIVGNLPARAAVLSGLTGGRKEGRVYPVKSNRASHATQDVLDPRGSGRCLPSIEVLASTPHAITIATKMPAAYEREKGNVDRRKSKQGRDEAYEREKGNVDERNHTMKVVAAAASSVAVTTAIVTVPVGRRESPLAAVSCTTLHYGASHCTLHGLKARDHHRQSRGHSLCTLYFLRHRLASPCFCRAKN
ncbi:hypothetical protein E2C01_036502 [Portunus trituberculatus]|uniref:Uncharacterized protein n=1 Tax=Portunus trituberculatus TaxID=210409 RepID=A0A5B7F6V8_PORTR|nr:hypothetical protein [Portunus trituberculatus]